MSMLRITPILPILAAGLALAVTLASCSPAGVVQCRHLTGRRVGARGTGLWRGAEPPARSLRSRGRLRRARWWCFFYGGSWQTGSRAMYRFVGAALASRGVIAIIPDYRHYPEVRFPAFMDDAAEAVAWTRANAARFGGDPDHLFLMGHSAGAQIAALLALDQSYLRRGRNRPGHPGRLDRSVGSL